MRKGWFKLPGQDGDRTIEEQWIGLEAIDWKGKRVIDLGCAEGALSALIHDAGAVHVLGLEVVKQHVDVARAMDLPRADFAVRDLNTWTPEKFGGPRYDIALMLAVLHKLRNPTEFLYRVLPVIGELCIVRLPPTGPTIVDDRSGRRPHDILIPFRDEGWTLARAGRGPRNEWMGYFAKAPA